MGKNNIHTSISFNLSQDPVEIEKVLQVWKEPIAPLFPQGEDLDVELVQTVSPHGKTDAV